MNRREKKRRHTVHGGGESPFPTKEGGAGAGQRKTGKRREGVPWLKSEEEGQAEGYWRGKRRGISFVRLREHTRGKTKGKRRDLSREGGGREENFLREGEKADPASNKVS